MLGRIQRIVGSLPNLDAYPYQQARAYVPPGWTIQTPQGIVASNWKPSNVALYPSTKARQGKKTVSQLCEELKGKPVLPAEALFFFCDNPHRIPSQWEGKIFFLDTLFHDSGGHPCVMYLYKRRSGRWDWNSLRLTNLLEEDSYAAVSI